MSQKTSRGKLPQHAARNTALLIQQAYLTATTNRITRNPQYLDDERLPEGERVAVLREIFHRNIRTKQIECLARHISPLLGGIQPQNLLVYGPSGTGKSVTCLHFLSTLSEICDQQSVPFRYFYVDLTTPKTCFGALNEMAISVDGNTRRYRKKGMALDSTCEMLIASMNRFQGYVCVVVDEVDNVTSDGDVFYTFLAKTLPKKVQPKLFYLFLTNSLVWEKNVDPRVFSVLKKMDMIFEPYDAVDLVAILNLRVEKALDAAKVDPGAIHKIAAYASRETGDARKAVELLVKAVKVAESSTGCVGESEVDQADRMLEVDKTEQMIGALAVQQRVALQACYAGFRGERGSVSTGHAYRAYTGLCSREGCRALTQRRFSDMVSFLDLYGLVNARVISKGRYGKTRELSSSLPLEVVRRLLREDG
jgi:cell division control protein 6